jgi:phage shock protein PspC (stress-responsive transcriptional regulator)
MNEVSRIHLARVSYEIDIAAKKELESYLNAIKRSLGKETDAMEDIEIRMTEILAERGVVQGSVVTESDVKAIVEQLGEPKDFASNDDSSHDVRQETAKKYYRDSENGILGGVIAGLAAYTGWDVTLLRILAVALAIIPVGWGWLVVVYLVVWICAPEAKSVSEKMEMRGEPINLESLKESAKKVGEQAERTGNEVAAKLEVAGQKISEEVPKVGAVVGRVLMVFCGVVGLMVSVSILFGLVIGSNSVLFWLTGVEIAHKPLLVVTVAFAVALIAVAVVLGLVMSTAFMIGKFTKGYKVSVTVLAVLLVVLATSVASLSASWAWTAGRDGVKDTAEKFVNDAVWRDGDDWCVGICKD